MAVHKYFLNVVDNMLYVTCSQSAAFEGGERVQNQYIFLQVMILQSDGQFKRSK